MSRKSAEELLARRKTIESKIQGVVTTLSRFVNVSQLGVAAADAASRVRNYLNLYGKGNESQIRDSKKAELHMFKEDAERKKTLYLKKKQEEESLRQELATLRSELESIGCRATIGDVLQLQADVAAIEDHINKLKEAVTREEEQGRLDDTDSQLLADLRREREDLQAEIALGSSVDQARLDRIKEQITEAETRISVATTVGEQSSISIVGLTRKIAEAEKALTDKKGVLQRVYGDFLATEAEKAGAEFVELSEKLWEKFTRIVALGMLIEKHPEARGKSIISGPCRAFRIPSFNLESCQTGFQHQGLLHSFQQLNIPAAVEATKKEMMALGISHLD